MPTPRPAVTWRVLDLPQGLEEPDRSVLERAAQELGLSPGQVRGARFARRSVDARRRRGVLRLVCHVDLVVDAGLRPPRLKRALRSGRAREAPEPGHLAPPAGSLAGRRVVVVGSGPAGVFAALPLALAGAEVTLLERGAPIERRHRHLVPFHRGGPLDPETNLLFGEGGAGTYSDGKLYTRVDDPLEVPLLEELVAAGAPPDILFDGRAHVGTDRLHRLLPRLRARMEAAGVRFAFDTRLEGLVADAGPERRVRAVRTSAGELACDALVLAVGHSARDTWRALARDGVPFEAKPFQFGVRVEHPQELVTRGRYGDGPGAEVLGPASYNLTARGADGVRGAHSFCMCPGGRIVASVSEVGGLCTNGMSNSTHSSRWANAAVVTTVRPEEFGGEPGDPFAGVDFQRRAEQAFFEAGGGTYAAPAQRAPDFLAGRESGGELATSYTFGAVPGRVDALLPPAVRDALRAALVRFGRAIPGFDGPEGLLVGVETRSSGPVQVPREAGDLRVRGWGNLWAVGEGAGWAGGIMSAAIDGARAAHRAAACAAAGALPATPPGPGG